MPPESIASPISNWPRASAISCGVPLPDEELLDVAEKGHLHEQAVLDAQVKRMLQDQARRRPSSKTSPANGWNCATSIPSSPIPTSSWCGDPT
jgi:hypothetical protein